MESKLVSKMRRTNLIILLSTMGYLLTADKFIGRNLQVINVNTNATSTIQEITGSESSPESMNEIPNLQLNTSSSESQTNPVTNIDEQKNLTLGLVINDTNTNITTENNDSLMPNMTVNTNETANVSANVVNSSNSSINTTNNTNSTTVNYSLQYQELETNAVRIGQEMNLTMNLTQVNFTNETRTKILDILKEITETGKDNEELMQTWKNDKTVKPEDAQDFTEEYEGIEESLGELEKQARQFLTDNKQGLTLEEERAIPNDKGITLR